MADLAQPFLTHGERKALSGEIISTLTETYNIGEWLDWKHITKGRSNASFLIMISTGQFVLRRSNPKKDIKSLRLEIQLVNHLKNQRYPAPELIRTHRGEEHFKHQGIYYILSRFIPGHPYDPQNQNHLQAAGWGLGLYHKLVKDFSALHKFEPTPVMEALGPESVLNLLQVEHLAQPFLNTDQNNLLADASTYMRRESDYIYKRLSECYPSLRKVVIHASFGQSALIFDGDILAGVVDYDRVAYDLRIMDLGYTLKAFCGSHHRIDLSRSVRLDQSRLWDFLTAYKSVTSLSDTEIQILPLSLRAQRLLKVLRRCASFLSKNIIQPREEKHFLKLLKMINREMIWLRWLKENNDDLLRVVYD